MQKYFSKKFSKIQVLNSILDSLNESGSKEHKLIIHTANGLYSGKLKSFYDLDYSNISESDDILTCYRKMFLSSLDKYENSDNSDDIEIPENSITIELENVELITSMKTVHLPFVSIFLDQIIGISLGSLE